MPFVNFTDALAEGKSQRDPCLRFFLSDRTAVTRATCLSLARTLRSLKLSTLNFRRSTCRKSPYRSTTEFLFKKKTCFELVIAGANKWAELGYCYIEEILKLIVL